MSLPIELLMLLVAVPLQQQLKVVGIFRIERVREREAKHENYLGLQQ